MKIDSVQWPVYKGVSVLNTGQYYIDKKEYYNHPNFAKIEQILGGKLNHNMSTLLHPHDMYPRHRNQTYFNIGEGDWIIVHDDNTLEFMHDKDYQYLYGEVEAII